MSAAPLPSRAPPYGLTQEEVLAPDDPFEDAEGNTRISGEPMGSHPSETAAIGARKRRWEGINAVLDINKKGKIMKDGANWAQVKEFFPLVTTGNVQTTTGVGLPEPIAAALHQHMSFVAICFGSITAAKRFHFISPIVIMACSFFNGDVEILAEEDIEGIHFMFVLKRGIKRICIAEAKKDDILQGKTQCLIGCASLCEVDDDLSVSYGISTNYLEWCFLKYEDGKVTEEILTIGLESNRPTIESLRNIATKIIAILQ